MPANNEEFPWSSYYGHYNYFEKMMGNHDKVATLTPIGDGVYELVRTQGNTMRVFICECYAFGVAEYMHSVEQLGALDAVVIGSAWCGYSPDVKRHCREEEVGIFAIREFMAALHLEDCWNYLTKAELKYFKRNCWL